MNNSSEDGNERVPECGVDFKFCGRTLRRYIPIPILKDPDECRSTLIHEFMAESTIATNLEKLEPVEAIFGLDGVKAKYHLQTDEDGEPTCELVRAKEFDCT